MSSILKALTTANLSQPSSNDKNKIKLSNLINNAQTTSPNHKSQKWPNFFPDFYDYNTVNNENSSEPQLFGLFPSDYDGGLVPNNDSFFMGYKSTPISITNQLSAPLMYILCMLGLYLVIILIAFMSALYSHRKRIGYNYDDTIEYIGQSDESESSDENQLLDQELENLNSCRDDDSNEMIDDSMIDIPVDSNCESNNVKNNETNHFANYNINEFSSLLLAKLNLKFKSRKLNQFLKQYNKPKVIKKLKNKKLRKIRNEKLSFLFLKRLVKLFPISKNIYNQTSSSSNLNNQVPPCSTEMQTRNRKSSIQQTQFHNLDMNKSSNHHHPLLLENDWNDENEL